MPPRRPRAVEAQRAALTASIARVKAAPLRALSQAYAGPRGSEALAYQASDGADQLFGLPPIRASLWPRCRHRCPYTFAALCRRGVSPIALRRSAALAVFLAPVCCLAKDRALLLRARDLARKGTEYPIDVNELDDAQVRARFDALCEGLDHMAQGPRFVAYAPDAVPKGHRAIGMRPIEANDPLNEQTTFDLRCTRCGQSMEPVVEFNRWLFGDFEMRVYLCPNEHEAKACRLY